ncbi:hypothetical protein ACFQH6_00155 [Halobacteriaceae archaeon GCM10025711]
MSDLVPFHELALAAYCPRKLYYARQADREPPPEVDRARELAFEYDDLLAADALAARSIRVPPARFRRNLRRARERFADRWTDLLDPPERGVVLAGRDARGRVDKVLADPPVPSLVSPGEPPETGVWRPQSVRAVAAAKALAWREERPVETAFVEYPRTGVVRRVRLTTRRKARYRTALRTVRALDGPPPRVDNDEKCAACEYREQCGVRTRSLRSLL